MKYGAGPYAPAFWVKPDSYIPTIGIQVSQAALSTCCEGKIPKFIHDPDLRVRHSSIFCLHLTLRLAWTAATAAL